MKTRKIIKIETIDGTSTFIPYEDNINKLKALDFEDLKKKFSKYKEIEMSLHEITEDFIMPHISNLLICDETGLYLYADLAYKKELWATPTDNEPVLYSFMNAYMYDCFYGKVYVKDFDYFYCETCDRHICCQDPSNGYKLQFRSFEENENGTICIPCYDMTLLQEGAGDIILNNKRLYILEDKEQEAIEVYNYEILKEDLTENEVFDYISHFKKDYRLIVNVNSFLNYMKPGKEKYMILGKLIF